MKKTKPYSELSIAIDLIIEEYKTFNPIEISEFIWESLGLCISIHEISDYLDVNRIDYETESIKQYYNLIY